MNNLHKGIKGVIFDMDGTLLDSMGIWENFMDVFRKNNNIEGAINLYELIEEMSVPQIAEYVSKKYLPKKTYVEILKEWDDIIIEYHQTEVKLKDGVRDYLDFLKANNIKMCIATESAPRIINAALTTHNLAHYFEFCLSSKDTGIGKTHKQIYCDALSKLGVKIDECLVFEDAYYAVQTATNAGFKVVGLYDYFSQKNYPPEQDIKQLPILKYFVSFEEILKDLPH